LVDSSSHKGVEIEVTKQNQAFLKLSTKSHPKLLCLLLIGVHMMNIVLCQVIELFVVFIHIVGSLMQV
jgi:hypothetical protein